LEKKCRKCRKIFNCAINEATASIFSKTIVNGVTYIPSIPSKPGKQCVNNGLNSFTVLIKWDYNEAEFHETRACWDNFWVISGFRREVNEIFALLGCYATQIVSYFSWTACTLKMGPTGCPETSVNNYRSMQCNNPEERRSLENFREKF
jgi:hypothetical protein